MKEIILNESINHRIIPAIINDLNIWIRKYNDMIDKHHMIETSNIDIDPLVIVEWARELRPISDEIIHRVEKLKIRIRDNKYNIIDDLNDIIDEINRNEGNRYRIRLEE